MPSPRRILIIEHGRVSLHVITNDVSDDQKRGRNRLCFGSSVGRTLF